MAPQRSCSHHASQCYPFALCWQPIVSNQINVRWNHISQDYERAIDGTAYRTDGEKGPIKKPHTLLAGLQRLLVGVLMLVLHMKLSAIFPIKTMYDATFIATVPYYERYGRLMMAMLAERFKFYFAWKVNIQTFCILLI